MFPDADSYGCTLNSLSREGWKVMIAHPNTTEWSFFDYADEKYSINELIDCETMVRNFLSLSLFLSSSFSLSLSLSLFLSFSLSLSLLKGNL